MIKLTPGRAVSGKSLWQVESVDDQASRDNRNNPTNNIQLLKQDLPSFQNHYMLQYSQFKYNVKYIQWIVFGTLFQCLILTTYVQLGKSWARGKKEIYWEIHAKCLAECALALI